MCKLYKFLYRLVPSKRFQSFLIKKHFSVCSLCQQEFETDEKLKEIFAHTAWTKDEKSLWPEIKPKLHTPEKITLEEKRKYGFSFIRKWHWAMAGLALAIMVGLNLLIQQGFQEKAPVKGASLEKERARVIIKHAEIRGKKAKPYVYQTPDVSFIWFTETKETGG